MSVLIRGMEMPKSCQDCPLNYDQMACIVTGTRWWSDTIVITNFDSEKERLFDCPLIEVKEPHGRRIVETGDCNSCSESKNCKYVPKLGEQVRYNCPFYKRR